MRPELENAAARKHNPAVIRRSRPGCECGLGLSRDWRARGCHNDSRSCEQTASWTVHLNNSLSREGSICWYKLRIVASLCHKRVASVVGLAQPAGGEKPARATAGWCLLAASRLS